MKKFLRNIITLGFLEDKKSLERKDYISRGRTKMVFFIIFVFFFVWILIANIGQMLLIGTVRGQNLSELADQNIKLIQVYSLIEERYMIEMEIS